MKMQKKYIIEHMDELGEWSILEYIHICDIVKDTNAIFTNFNENADSIFKNIHKPQCYNRSINELKDVYDWNRTCLLDMKAERPLKHEDFNKFDFFLFGGILGNVPNEDRTSVLRKMNFPFSRNLGSVQMTTNTAVLVCHIILNDKIELENIPFVDNPEILLRNDKESIILPFRFVSEKYYTKNKHDINKPIIPKNFEEYLGTLGDQQINIDDFY